MPVSVLIPTNKPQQPISKLVDRLLSLEEVSQIILVQDGIQHSERNLPIEYIEILTSGKLNAIKSGIQYCKENYIWILDDDVDIPNNYHPENWQQYQIVFGKLAFDISQINSVVQAIQYYETSTLNKLNSIFFQKCNHLLWSYGGNIIIHKNILKQFQSKKYEKWNSGDDMFLLEYARKKRIEFTFSDKELFTVPELTWKKSIKQRTRWASKSMDLSMVHLFIGSIVLVYFLFLAVSCFLGMFFHPGFYSFLVLPCFHLLICKKPTHLSVFQVLITPYAHLIHFLLVFFNSLLVSLKVNFSAK